MSSKNNGSANGTTQQIVQRIKYASAKTVSQSKFMDKADDYDIHFITGVAGTGKSFITLLYALKKMYAGLYKRIILIKPIVESEENLGFLPGPVDDKIAPFHESFMYNLDIIVTKGERQRLLAQDKVVQIPIAHLRGITFEDSIILCDEFQNATKGQIKLVLTRLGNNSRMIMTGDVNQSDLKYGSGLEDAMKRFADMDEINVMEFDPNDNVRNQIITKILSKYE